MQIRVTPPRHEPDSSRRMGRVGTRPPRSHSDVLFGVSVVDAGQDDHAVVRVCDRHFGRRNAVEVVVRCAVIASLPPTIAARDGFAKR